LNDFFLDIFFPIISFFEEITKYQIYVLIAVSLFMTFWAVFFKWKVKKEYNYILFSKENIWRVILGIGIISSSFFLSQNNDLNILSFSSLITYLYLEMHTNTASLLLLILAITLLFSIPNESDDDVKYLDKKSNFFMNLFYFILILFIIAMVMYEAYSFYYDDFKYTIIILILISISLVIFSIYSYFSNEPSSLHI
jgi:hypothetical protein